MYKFRSMRVETESVVKMAAAAGDSRCTRVGAFLRKYSIDELPQLVNVLKGDMSLVGPRPEIPAFVEQFMESIPSYMWKHAVRPGMTGWAQIHGLRGGGHLYFQADSIRYGLFGKLELLAGYKNFVPHGFLPAGQIFRQQRERGRENETITKPTAGRVGRRFAPTPGCRPQGPTPFWR